MPQVLFSKIIHVSSPLLDTEVAPSIGSFPAGRSDVAEAKKGFVLFRQIPLHRSFKPMVGRRPSPFFFLTSLLVPLHDIHLYLKRNC
jgi:hypothetical protein